LTSYCTSKALTHDRVSATFSRIAHSLFNSHLIAGSKGAQRNRDILL